MHSYCIKTASAECILKEAKPHRNLQDSGYKLYLEVEYAARIATGQRTENTYVGSHSAKELWIGSGWRCWFRLCIIWENTGLQAHLLQQVLFSMQLGTPF